MEQRRGDSPSRGLRRSGGSPPHRDGSPPSNGGRRHVESPRGGRRPGRGVSPSREGRYTANDELARDEQVTRKRQHGGSPGEGVRGFYPTQESPERAMKRREAPRGEQGARRPGPSPPSQQGEGHRRRGSPAHGDPRSSDPRARDGSPSRKRVCKSPGDPRLEGGRHWGGDNGSPAPPGDVGRTKKQEKRRVDAEEDEGDTHHLSNQREEEDEEVR